MTAGRRIIRQFILYVVVDVVCIGIGMGVPIPSILLGLLVGWRMVDAFGLAGGRSMKPWRESCAGLGITAAVTFVFMGVIWGRCLPMLFDPSADFANFGMPLLLFEPRASFVAWLGLMVVVSPVLQFLMTLLGANVALLRGVRSRRAGGGARTQ